MRTSIKTTREAIIGYWAARQDEGGLGVDWAEAHERCWRCGHKSHLERCHIVPHSLGGLDSPSNLVLLCYRCHKEAPNVADPRFMWIWMRAHCVPFYNTYWSIRGAFEFEQMFGRKPFTRIGLDKSRSDQVQILLSEEIQNATIHFGEGHINPATIACIFARVEERLTGSFPKLLQPEWGNSYALESMGFRMRTPEDMSDAQT